MNDTRTLKERHADGLALHAIEGNPLDADDLAMFEMFDREGWSDDQQLAYIIDQSRKRTVAHAAE